MDDNRSLYQNCFSILAQSTVDFVICLDKNYLVTELNRAAESFYQCQLKEVAGLSYFSICALHNGDLTFSQQDIDGLAANIPLSKRTNFANKDYNILWTLSLALDEKKQTAGYLIIGKKVAKQNCFADGYAAENAFLNNFIRLLPGHVYLKNREGVYLGSNDLNAQSAGFNNAAGILGKTDYDTAWRKEAEVIKQNDNRVIQEGVPTVLEESGTIRDGSFATVITHKVPIYDKNEAILGVLGVSIDITSSLKKAQELLKAEEVDSAESDETRLYLENLVANLPENIYWSDKKGVYRGCNNHQAASLGLDKAEIIGKTIYDVAKILNFDIKLADQIYINDQKVMKTKQVLIKEEEVIEVDGKKRIYLSKKIPTLDNHGNCIGLLSISTDMTVFKQAENKIKEAEEVADERSSDTRSYLENLIANLPDNIYWSDKNGVYRGCNNQQAASFGLKKEEFIGKTTSELAKILHWDKNLVDAICKNDKEVMKTGRILTKEEEVVWVDGKKRVYLSRKIPATDSKGNCVGLLGISTDITRLKEVEYKLKEAKEKSEALGKAKTEFIANMSHDVKTPLSGMIAIAELLTTRIQEEYKDLAQDLLQAGQHLMTFFENCIELSKLESNVVGLVEETFNLKHLLHEIFHLFQPAMKAKGLILQVNYAENMPRYLLGSRVNLYRIILNLLGNAVKFTSKGSITVSADLSQKSTLDKIVIKLTIADTGIGIPKHKQKMIFERFTRLIPSYQGTYEGSGIGLYIVQKFVKAMGGEIYIKSQEANGSQFTVVLPFQIPLLADNEYETEDELLPMPSSAKIVQPEVNSAKGTLDLAIKGEAIETAQPKILLVEDNLMAQKGASLLLSSLGCKVDVADCGQKAIDLFQAGHYAVVLMDIGLPDLKGYQVASRFRMIERDTSFRVPIFGLSAHATEEEKRLSIEAGMEDMLCKPLFLNQAKKILAQYAKNIPWADSAELLAMKDNLEIINLEKNTPNHNEENQLAWEMIDELIQSLPKVSSEIERDYRAGDINSLIEKTHKLHGSLCYTNTPHLLDAVRILELGLRNKEQHKLDELFENFIKAVHALEEAYKSL